MKFRKKPIVIEAVQWTGLNKEEIEDFMHSKVDYYHDLSQHLLIISTLEGQYLASPNDWIIRGRRGEYYPCKPDIFAETYEPIPDPPEESE